MPSAPTILPRVMGTARLERIGGLSFPVNVFTQHGEPLAHLGRLGWLRVYMGPGDPVRLANGERWRIKGLVSGRYLCPAVLSDRGRLAMAYAGVGNYAINGRDFAYVLNPAEPAHRGRARVWSLTSRGDDVAMVDVSHRLLDAARPVELPAALLCFVVLRLGVPGEKETGVPLFHWD